MITTIHTWFSMSAQAYHTNLHITVSFNLICLTEKWCRLQKCNYLKDEMRLTSIIKAFNLPKTNIFTSWYCNTKHSTVLAVGKFASIFSNDFSTSSLSRNMNLMTKSKKIILYWTNAWITIVVFKKILNDAQRFW